MLAHTYLESIGFETVYSLYVILGIWLSAYLASVVFPEKKAETEKVYPIVRGKDRLSSYEPNSKSLFKTTYQS